MSEETSVADLRAEVVQLMTQVNDLVTTLEDERQKVKERDERIAHLVTHLEVRGEKIDNLEREVKDLRAVSTPQQASNTELTQLRAEVAALKAERATHQIWREQAIHVAGKLAGVSNELSRVISKS